MQFNSNITPVQCGFNSDVFNHGHIFFYLVYIFMLMKKTKHLVDFVYLTNKQQKKRSEILYLKLRTRRNTFSLYNELRA